MVGMARSGLFETPLAMASLLVYLYWEELVLITAEPRRKDRDRFILGMPEAVSTLYATLARRGFFEREHLWHYRRLGAMLQEHPDFHRIPGMDAPCLNVQPSLAMAASLAGELSRRSFKPRVLFLVSDKAFQCDEFAEEAVRTAKEKNLPNLMMIVVSRGDCTQAKAACTNWDRRDATAEDFNSLEAACDSFDFSRGAPKALFVDSARGADISLLGSSKEGRQLSMGELDQALEELEVRSNENR